MYLQTLNKLHKDNTINGAYKLTLTITGLQVDNNNNKLIMTQLAGNMFRLSIDEISSL